MASPWYVTHDAGGGGVGTAGDPFTLTEALDTVAAGETVYVKASGVYNVEYATGGAKNCVMYANTDGTKTNRIRWVGYHTTIADGGIVTIDATDSLTSAILIWTADYNSFENFRFIQGTVYGADINGQIQIYFKNCGFEENGDVGAKDGSRTVFVACRFINNVQEGYFSLLGSCTWIACIFSGNNKSACLTTTQVSIFYACVFFDNGSGSVPYGIYDFSDTYIICLNCTFDGENIATSRAVSLVGAVNNVPPVMVNCIFHDFASGVYADAGIYSPIINCLFNSNTADTTNIAPVPTTGDGIGNDGKVEAVPGFTNEAGDDYTLAGGSDAIGAGIDADFTTKLWASYDGATNPPVV